jgi:methionyl-tRNA formyltransferase
LSWTGSDPPGTVLIVRDDHGGAPRLAVATGEGALELHSLQLSGKRVLAAPEFLRGHPNFVRARLGTPLAS